VLSSTLVKNCQGTNGTFFSTFSLTALAGGGEQHAVIEEGPLIAGDGGGISTSPLSSTIAISIGLLPSELLPLFPFPP
jgi:hypothetical protein